MPPPNDDAIAVLPMPPGGCLASAQAQRVTCLAVTLALTRGRSVHIGVIRAIAEWLYDGNSHDD